jgi:glyoxylase-like metal-dependent hydrolase (beta-lactamase superfamily II)
MMRGLVAPKLPPGAKAEGEHVNGRSTTPALLSRRQILKGGFALAGGTLLPAWMARPVGAALQQAAADPLAQMRAAPIGTVKLSDSLVMLSGPGGNVVVLNGPDGKIVVDTFVQPAWDRLKQTLDGLGSGRITSLIDTHWHFDHTDNNAAFRKAGAAIVAHENTKKRMAEPHELLGLKFPPSPADALPTQTFASRHSLSANGEQMALVHRAPSHTDTDITIRFQKANVIHMGDLFFNGMYPFFDSSTAGNINGMISVSSQVLKEVDAKTQIVPGHGPLGDLAALTRSHDMMVTVRDRVQKLKKAGRTLEEVVAAAPTKDLDATWGKGFLQPNQFVTIVYNTL